MASDNEPKYLKPKISETEEPLMTEEVMATFEDDSQWVDPAVPVKKRRSNSRRRTTLGWLAFKVTIAMLVLGVIGVCAVAYFARNFIISRAESRLFDELEKSGVHLSYESREYGFRRGLVLNGATLFESAAQKKPVLSLSNLGVRVGLWRLIRERNAEAAEAEVSTDAATLVFFADGQPVGEVTGLTTLLYGTTKELSIDRAEALVNGLEVSAGGKIKFEQPSDESVEEEEVSDPSSDGGDAGDDFDFAFLEGVDEWLQFGSEGSAPRLRLMIDLDLADPETSLEIEALFSGQAFTWRDIPIDSANVALTYAEGEKVLRFPAFHFVYDGGVVGGKMLYDLPGQKIAIENLHSNANVIGFVTLLGVPLPEGLATIDFHSPPDLSMYGMLELADVMRSDLKIRYHHWDGFDYPLADGRLFPARELHGDFTLSGQRVSTERFSANLLGGDVVVAGNAGVGEVLDYEVDLSVTHLPLQQVLDFSKVDREQPGYFDGRFEGRGAKGVASLSGGGSMRVSDAELLQVPVIGPIQKMLATVVPLFGQKSSADLDATFQVENGVLRSDDLAVRGDGTRIRVAGEYDLPAQTANFAASANLDGPLGLATGLVSKLLEVEGNGPVDDLDIRLKTVPMEFATETVKGMLNLAGGATGLLTDGVGKLTGGTLDAVEGAAGLMGDVADGTMDAMGKVGQNTAAAVGKAGENTASAVKGLGQNTGKAAQSVGRGAEQGIKNIGKGLQNLIPNQKKGAADTAPAPEVPAPIGVPTVEPTMVNGPPAPTPTPSTTAPTPEVVPSADDSTRVPAPAEVPKKKRRFPLFQD